MDQNTPQSGDAGGDSSLPLLEGDVVILRNGHTVGVIKNNGLKVLCYTRGAHPVEYDRSDFARSATDAEVREYRSHLAATLQAREALRR
jgi:hypothetical protein